MRKTLEEDKKGGEKRGEKGRDKKRKKKALHRIEPGSTDTKGYLRRTVTL